MYNIDMKNLLSAKMRKKDGRGFTLIELIVVMAIMAILAAIAVPGVSKNVATREKQAALSDTRQFYRLAMSSVTDLRLQGVKPVWAASSEQRQINNAAFAEKIAVQLYNTTSSVDTDIAYYDNVAKNYQKLNAETYPVNKSATFFVAENHEPYVVITVKPIMKDSSFDNAFAVTVSYHNKNSVYKYDNAENSYNYNAWTANGGETLSYTFQII